MTQALSTQRAVSARGDRRFEMRDSVPVEQQMLAAVIQLVACGANAQRLGFVIEEVFDAKELWLLRKELSLLPTFERALLLVPLLVTTRRRERRIPPTIVTV